MSDVVERLWHLADGRRLVLGIARVEPEKDNLLIVLTDAADEITNLRAERDEALALCREARRGNISLHHPKMDGSGLGQRIDALLAKHPEGT